MTNPNPQHHPASTTPPPELTNRTLLTVTTKEQAELILGPQSATHPPEHIAAACKTAERQLQRIYRIHYQHHRSAGPEHADHQACRHLRAVLADTITRHLPSICLVEWMNPHPTVIDSSWAMPGWEIDVYWDYHPNWTIGDPTALTIWHQPTTPNNNDTEVAG